MGGLILAPQARGEQGLVAGLALNLQFFWSSPTSLAALHRSRVDIFEHFERESLNIGNKANTILLASAIQIPVPDMTRKGRWVCGTSGTLYLCAPGLVPRTQPPEEEDQGGRSPSSQARTYPQPSGSDT